MLECPQVQISIDSSNRHVAVIDEGFDAALRVRFPPLEDSDPGARTLGHDTRYIVASPALVARLPSITAPADLSSWPGLDYGRSHRKHVWILDGPNATTVGIPIGRAWSTRGPSAETDV